MDWERASPRSEAVVVAGDKRSKCNIKSSVNDLKSCPTNTNLTNASPSSSSPNPNSITNNKTTTTTSTNNTTTTGQFVSMSRKNKPIPPPLDLSIGAANLSLHHPNLSSPSLPISSSLSNHLHHHHHLNNHHYIHSSSHHSTSGSPSGLHPSWYCPTNQQQQQQQPLPTTSSSSSSSSSATTSQQLHHTPYLGSPKYTQPDKTLPLRKRWHSWSPILMNGQDESLLPLYSDSHLPTPISGVKQESQQQQQQQQQQQSEMNLTEGGDHHNHTSHNHNNHHGNQNHAHSIISLHHQAYPYSVSASSSPSPSTVSTTSSITTPTTNSYRLPSYGHVLSHSHSHHGHGGHHGLGHGSPLNGHSNPLGLGLSIQTPSPFYTPNEPSPKFMNSPVFSYSTPDTSLYQGPFSPMRSSLYPPPSSPFTNLSLNTPGGPMSTGSGSSLSNSCFSNMIPSTLLSPAPSQTSTNSLSYEDLHEKSSSSSTASGVSGSGSGSGTGMGGGSGGGGGNVGGIGGVSLNFLNPVWSIFMHGTKVRFTQNHAMSSMDWFPVDYLAQNSEQLFHFKGEYAPHGLEVRTLVMTSSSKERIQITFVPVGDLDHPSIEVDCEPSHPFMVEKKGWCSVKPDVFLESFGAHCPQLICGDICLNISPASLSSTSTSRLQPNLSVQLNVQPISQSHHHHQQQQQVCVGGGSSSNSNNNQISQHSIMSGMTSASSISIGTGSTSPYSAISNTMTNNNNPPNSNSNNNESSNNASAAIINHANAIISLSSNSPPILNLNTNSLTHNLMTLTSVKMEPGMSMDEKSIPISVVPQTQQQQQQQQHSSLNSQSVHHLQQQHHQQQLHHLHSQQQQQQHQRQQQHQSSSPTKKFAVPSSPMNLGSGNGPLPSPAKRVKECHGGQGPQEQKGRRPMNAFLLFAKDKRPELIQQFPGKDNRSISVLLGEAWANLEPPEKEKYSSSARARAEEQKRIHPDCWKRKRSQSTSS